MRMLQSTDTNIKFNQYSEVPRKYLDIYTMESIPYILLLGERNHSAEPSARL